MGVSGVQSSINSRGATSEPTDFFCIVTQQSTVAERPHGESADLSSIFFRSAASSCALRAAPPALVERLLREVSRKRRICDATEKDL